MTLRLWVRAQRRYHRISYLTLGAGAFLVTSLLTGALGVGDSVRTSLEEISAGRLGRTEYLAESRLGSFQDDLDQRLEAAWGLKGAALLELPARSITGPGGLQASSVRLIGAVVGLKNIFPGEDWSFPDAGSVFLNRRLAGLLDAGAGDEVVIQVLKDTHLGSDNLFSPRNPAGEARSFRVAKVLDDRGAGGYSRQISQEAPSLVWLSREVLQEMSGMEGQASHLLLSETGDREALPWRFRDVLEPGDLGLSITAVTAGTLAHSRRIFFDPAQASILQQLFPGAQPLYGNFLREVKAGGRSVPFVFAHTFAASSPPVGSSESPVAVSRLMAGELGLAPGEDLSLTWFVSAPGRPLETRTGKVTTGILMDQEEMDRTRVLLPEFPGMSGATSCLEWDPALPLDLDRVRPRDEEFWNQWGPSPRILLPQETAREFWGTGGGGITGFLLPRDITPEQVARTLRTEDPEVWGFRLIPLKDQAFTAAGQGVDFGLLFLSLTMVLVFTVLMLLSQLFRLFLSSRREETGTLEALGFTYSRIRRLYRQEMGLPSAAGVLAGLAGSLGFNALAVSGLNTLWKDAVGTDALRTALNPLTLAAGFFLSLLALGWVAEFQIRKVLKDPVLSRQRRIQSSGGGWRLPAASACVLGILSLSAPAFFPAAASLVGLPETYLRFFAGVGLLGALLLGLRALLFLPHRSRGRPGVLSWVGRRLERSRSHALGLVLVFSLSVFLLQTLWVFGTPVSSWKEGSGGFAHWAETAAPPSPETLASLPEHLGFSLVEGDPADCRNLNLVERPALLGFFPKQMDGRFFLTAARGTGTEGDVWTRLSAEGEPGIIPALGDEAVLTWILKKSLGDTLSLQGDRGEKLELRLVGALRPSVFQGYLLIPRWAVERYFPSSRGERVFLLSGPEQPEQAPWYRTLKSHGLHTKTTAARLEDFHRVEATYLSIFGSLSILALALGTLGLGLLILQDSRAQRGETALMEVLGFSPGRILLLQAGEKLLLLGASLVVGLAASWWTAGPEGAGQGADFMLPALVLAVPGPLWILLAAWRGSSRARGDTLAELKAEL